MAHLGTIKGRGRIIADGSDLGDVDYSISVFQSDGLKRAYGYIRGPESKLSAASKARGAVLLLEDGRTLDIVVSTGTSGEINRAQITVSGPVPSF